MALGFRARLVLASTVQVITFVGTAVAVLAWSTDEYAADQVHTAAIEARSRFEQQRDQLARTWREATQEYARSPRLLATAAIPDVDDATFTDVLAELEAPIVAVLDHTGRVVGSRGGWPAGTDCGTLVGCAAALRGEASDHVWMHATGPAFVALSPLQQGGELLGVLVRGLRIDHGFAARVPALSGHDHAITFGEAVLAQQWHVDASTADLRPLFELAHAPRSLATRDLVLRIDDVEWPGVCVPLHADGGIVFLAQDLRGIHALRDRTLAWLIVLGGVLGLAGLFWAIRTAKRLARPLQDLTAASERMRAGDLATRVARLDHDDELGRLAHSFNTMADTVQALVADVTDKAHRAEAANVAKDRFLTSVSHELRTPLTGIQSTAELLQQFGDSASPTERAEFLDTILRESERLGRRIGDALDYANLSGGRTPWTLGRVDLQAVCEGACRRLDSLQAMKPVSFLIMVEADAVLQGDREHLTQAVWHLVHNAWQWSPVGGAVDVTGRAVPNGFVLEVADRGPGVPAVDRERVFDTFAQGGDVLVDKPAGIGIGLKIAREVAIAHGGTVDYSDRPGGGACFRMLLRTVDRPIDRMVSAPEAHPEPVAPAAGT